MEKRIKIESQPFISPPGFFRWIREAVAPFKRKQATELLEGLGLSPDDAKFLANPKNQVTTTVEGEDLILEFTTPNRRKATA